MKQDDLGARAAATNVTIKMEDANALPESVESAPQGLDPTGTPKNLLPFASIDKPMSTSSNGN